MVINPLSANPTKWPNTLKQFVGSVFGHFVNLALKGLINTNYLLHLFLSLNTSWKKRYVKSTSYGNNRLLSDHRYLRDNNDWKLIQLIYSKKAPLSHPKYKFPKEFYVNQTLNHWANGDTSINFLEHFLITYIETQREELNNNSPWLLISDVFKGQWTDHVKEIVPTIQP